jgi:hypothetical protein
MKAVILNIFPLLGSFKARSIYYAIAWRKSSWLSAVRAKAGGPDGACSRACPDSYQLCEDKGILMSAHNSELGRVGTVKQRERTKGRTALLQKVRAAQTCAL